MVIFKKTSIIIFTLILPLATFSRLRAQDNGSGKYATEDTLSIDELVIVGLRQESKLARLPQAVSLMNERELRNGSYMSLPDAMSFIPGVWMQKTNHGGGSPFIRGLTGYQTLIIIDGVRFNNSTFRSGPNQYLNTIDPYTLDRIEVLRGAGSVQYGSDAIGGVVYLKTRETEFLDTGKKLSFKPLIKWISNDMELTGRAELSYQNKKNSIHTGITLKDFGDIKAGGDFGKLTPTGYNEISVDIKARRKLNSKNEISLLYQHLKQEDVPLYHKIINGDYSRYHFNPQQRDMAYAKHILTPESRYLDQLTTTLSYQNSFEKREKQKAGDQLIREETDRIRVFGFSLEGISRFSGNWTATSGIEFYRDFIDSETKTIYSDGSEKYSRGLYPDNSGMLSASAYSTHQINLNKLYLNGGLRYSTFSVMVSDSLFGKTNINPSALVATAGLSFEFIKQTYWVMSVSNSFRAPNINDVSSLGIADFRYEIPNFDLRPEYSLSFETGIKASRKRLYLALSLFRNHLKDLIINTETSYQSNDSIDGYKVYHRENIDKARIMGAESELKLKLSARSDLQGFLIYSWGQNLSKNEPVSRIPPLYSQINLKYSLSRSLSANISLIAAGKQERLSSGDISDDRIAEGGTSGWNILNFRMNLEKDKWRLNAGINNILNKAFRVHGSGVDGVGRNFIVSIGYIL